MDTDSTEPQARRVRIAFKIPPTLTTRPATHFVVHNTGHEFVISFFEVQPPYIIGDTPESQEEYEQVNQVDAECVGRIFLAPTRLVELTDLLVRHVASLTEGELTGRDAGEEGDADVLSEASS